MQDVCQLTAAETAFVERRHAAGYYLRSPDHAAREHFAVTDIARGDAAREVRLDGRSVTPRLALNEQVLEAGEGGRHRRV